MKRFLGMALALVMLVSVFTGCGCMDRNVSTHPGGKITEGTTEPSIMPIPTATHETDPRETTMPHMTDPTETGTESTGDNSTPTDTTVEPRSHGHSRDRAR